MDTHYGHRCEHGNYNWVVCVYLDFCRGFREYFIVSYVYVWFVQGRMRACVCLCVRLWAFVWHVRVCLGASAHSYVITYTLSVIIYA